MSSSNLILLINTNDETMTWSGSVSTNNLASHPHLEGSQHLMECDIRIGMGNWTGGNLIDVQDSISLELISDSIFISHNMFSNIRWLSINASSNSLYMKAGTIRVDMKNLSMINRDHKKNVEIINSTTLKLVGSNQSFDYSHLKIKDKEFLHTLNGKELVFQWKLENANFHSFDTAAKIEVIS